MDDRTLIERAAKAAGFELPSYPDDHDEIGRKYTEALGLWVFRPWGWGWFNPLNDDGDALRLAVKLRINIEHMADMAGRDFGVNCWPRGRGDCGVSEEDLRDYDAATRRALVRAAAALAEQRTGGRV